MDELREQILRLRFPQRIQNKEATPKTKRKILGHASPSKSPPLPAPKPALSDRPCVVVLNKPLEKLLIRSVECCQICALGMVIFFSYVAYYCRLQLLRSYNKVSDLNLDYEDILPNY